MKIINALLLGVMAILSHTVRSQNITDSHIQKLKHKNEITYADLAHENLGCPENSICSEQMGKKMNEWNRFIKNLEGDPSKISKLEDFRQNRGLPVAFLAKKTSSLPLDPILYSSRCKIHNPKNKEETVYKAMQFFKNDPRSKSAMFDPVNLYNEDGSQAGAYQVPYEETPLMVVNKKLILAREHENVFYYMSVSEKGDWQVVRPKQKQLSQALLRLENAQCPEDLPAKPEKYHLKYYCKSLWDADLKKNRVVRLAWSCP